MTSTDKPAASKPKNRTVRTDVPPATFAALEARAALEGSTVAAVARELLLAGVSEATKPPTKGEWAACMQWMDEQGLTPSALKMTLGLTTKRQALDWARQNGFTA